MQASKLKRCCLNSCNKIERKVRAYSTNYFLLLLQRAFVERRNARTSRVVLFLFVQCCVCVFSSSLFYIYTHMCAACVCVCPSNNRRESSWCAPAASRTRTAPPHTKHRCVYTHSHTNTMHTRKPTHEHEQTTKEIEQFLRRVFGVVLYNFGACWVKCWHL